MLPTPSLRQLRGKLPENVVILPTAPDRQVQQNYNRASRAAKLALREAQPWPREFIDPRRRECLKRAEVINSVKQTPELRILYALLAALDIETRKNVITTLAVQSLSGSTEAKQALEITRCTNSTIGDSFDMDWAFKRLAEDAQP